MTKLPFKAYRPIIIEGDDKYLRDHKPYSNVILITEKVDEHTDCSDSGDLVSIDSIYYQGVMEYI